jgi:hypothetical protein
VIRVQANDVGRAAARDPDETAEPGSSTVIALGVVGALIGFGVIYADKRSWHGTACFTGTPEFAFWLILASAQAGLWAIAALPVYRSLHDLWKWWPKNKTEIFTSMALFSVLVWGFLLAATFVPNLDYPLPNHHAKLLALSGLAFLVALGGVIGIWLVHAALKSNFANRTPGGEQIHEFLTLKTHLRRLLAIEGAIIGSAILASGALREAVLHATCIPKTAFPQVFVLGYGAFFSALLALVYAPVHLRLLVVGRRLRDDLAPVPDQIGDTFSAWWSRRQALDALLQLEVGVSQSLQASVAILTPLAGAIVGLLLGGAT